VGSGRAMPESNRIELTRNLYAAYASGDREVVEDLVADEGFAFFSPPDPGIDREAYFERCWPNSETIEGFEFKRLLEIGDDEVLVTYESTKTDGRRFRNTEVLRFDGDEKLGRVEVYFGWDVE
jgi:ketosteroid isomerase-like protein